MAEEKAKDNKKIIIGICSAIAIVAIIAVVAVIIIKNQKPTLDDKFFTSDSTKLVVNLDADSSTSSGSEVELVKQHQVYTYSGDTITSLKSYSEFKNEADAKKAYELYKNSAEAKDTYTDIELNGKFVVLTIPETQYKELKASQIKEYIEMVDAIKNMTTDTTNGSADSTTNDTISTDTNE